MRLARLHEETPMKAAFIALTLILAAGWVHAHSGGTDKNGCHNDHKNDGWHCH